MAASAANARPRLGCGFLRTISFPRRRISTWLTGKRNSFDKSTACCATKLAQLFLLLRRFPRSSFFAPRLLGCGFLYCGFLCCGFLCCGFLCCGFLHWCLLG